MSAVTFDLMGTDERLARARFLVAWLRERGWTTCTATAIRKEVSKERFPTTAEVSHTLAFLAEEGWVRPAGGGTRTGKVGRPAAAVWDVNPYLHIPAEKSE